MPRRSRPSSTRPDSKLDPFDVWLWKQLGERGHELTGYTHHSVFEDFTWNPDDTMSGAADDWAFEHLGVLGWTTEFWDIVQHATGVKQSTHFWYTGPTDDEALAVLRWCDEHNADGYVGWYPFEHPTLGPLALGGWNDLVTWINPPPGRLRDEVAGHADFAIHQALCSPRIELVHTSVTALGDGTWRIAAGIANTGWLATDITAWARKHELVRPLVAELAGADVLDGPARRQLGQLDGRASLRFRHGIDGTPDRVLASWTVRAPAGTEVSVTATHARAGTAVATLTLG